MEIKGVVRLKISHWPKINPKLSRSKSTLHYKSDQAIEKSIFDFSWSWPLAKSCDHENDLIFLVMALGP